MIASLNGHVGAQGSGYLIIEVAGIGYQVLVTEDFSRTTHIGDELRLFTRLIVREDSLTLYGFADTPSVQLFDELVKVSGVGPKSALSVLNDLSVGAIVNAVQQDDEKAFQKVSGIGPKTARLLVATLQGRLNDFVGLAQANVDSSNVDLSEKVLDALISLGWGPRDAEGAIDRLKEQGIFAQDYDLPQLMKLALLGLGSSR